MFYLKHKTTGKYLSFDKRDNVIWVDNKQSATSWSRECDALFVQNYYDDNAPKTPLRDCLFTVAVVIED